VIERLIVGSLGCASKGAAIKMGRFAGGSVGYLAHQRKRMKRFAGNSDGSFTLHVAGRSLSFVFHPDAFRMFFDPPASLVNAMYVLIENVL
jgi:hypothetical protein